ncbi:2-keto-4-pentenoate hydratase [Pseudotabrizicola formosa]|uniref:2-keto-4-pentenoate hydratase n=1 Tax=Pseudotabrizicola formosa TaxID=2030009 RepID=UPI000CD1730C|nr:fumarylacetoacetate hydrolase family protein [Pseudotabrizicola formosa]
MPDHVTQLASALRGAFSGPRLSALPPQYAPRDEAEAYAVQTAVLGSEAVAGWKVAPRRDGVIRTAPLAASRLLPDGGALPGGLVAPLLEVELALRLAQDVPDRATPDQVLAALGEVCVAFEILDSRFADGSAVPALTGLADAQSNRAFVAGSAGVPWGRQDLADVPLEIFCDGQLLQRTETGPGSAQVAEAVIWLADHAARRGLPLRRGQIIITGARLGPMPIPAGPQIRATAGGIGEVHLHSDTRL